MTLKSLIDQLKDLQKHYGDNAQVVFQDMQPDFDSPFAKPNAPVWQITQEFEVSNVSMQGNNDTGERQICLSNRTSV